MLKQKNVTLLKAYLSGNHAQLRFPKLRPMTYLGEVRQERLLPSNNLTHREARTLDWKKGQIFYRRQKYTENIKVRLNQPRL